MKTFPIPTPIRRLVLTVGLALTLLILALTASTQAAPAAQTVPPPTAVPANTPVPTVTPFDRDGDDGNRDDDNRNDDGGNNDSDDSRGDSGQNQQGNEPPAAPTAPAPAPAPEAVTTVAFPGRITGAGLNVRLGPGTDYDVAGTLTRGDEFDILGRNVENTWWLICCLPETEMRGWVSANFVETEFSRSAALTQLPVQPDDVALSDETVGAVEISESVSPTATQPTTQTTQSSTQAVTQAVTAAAAPASEELNETGLAFSAAYDSPYAMQGQSVRARYTITNAGDVEAAGLLLRNELPNTLTIDAEASSSSGDLMVFALDTGATVFAVEWPAIAPGQQVTATIALTLAADLPDGSVVDNLAVALADNAAPQTTGLSIGLPPAAPPTFR